MEGASAHLVTSHAPGGNLAPHSKELPGPGHLCSPFEMNGGCFDFWMGFYQMFALTSMELSSVTESGRPSICFLLKTPVVPGKNGKF